MKLPSVHALVQATINTCKRFPLSILFTLIGCFYCIRMNHLPYDSTDKYYYFINIIWSAYLGMLLALVFAIYSERNYFSAGTKLFAGIFAAGLTVAYYFSLPEFCVGE
jgi:hypothetical protein